MKPKLLLALALVLSAISNSQAGLIYCATPEGGREVVRANIENDLSGAGLLGKIPKDQVTMFNPLRFYLLDNMTNFDSFYLARAEFQCWQYLLLHGTNVIGGCFVSPKDLPPKKPDTTVLFNTGGSQETYTAMEIAKNLPQVKAHDYEVRRVGFIFVSFQALWLHGKADDIIIPLPRGYPDTARYFTAYMPYNGRQMAQILRSMVRDERLHSKLPHRF